MSIEPLLMTKHLNVSYYIKQLSLAPGGPLLHSCDPLPRSASPLSFTSPLYAPSGHRMLSAAWEKESRKESEACKPSTDRAYPPSWIMNRKGNVWGHQRKGRGWREREREGQKKRHWVSRRVMGTEWETAANIIELKRWSGAICKQVGVRSEKEQARY